MMAGTVETAVAPLVEVSDVSMTFGTNRVLKGINLSLVPGEIHVLLGANGSGKSTLVKILAGYQSPDSGGSLAIRGQRVRPPVKKSELRRSGVTFVHQDLALVPSLSVLENLSLDWYASADRTILPRRRLRSWAAQALRDYSLDIDLQTPVERIGPRERVELALVRALEYPDADDSGPSVLVLDEATALLDATDRAGTYSIMHRIADRGGAVLLITHDLDEAIDVGNRISVLRDGVISGELESGDPDSGEAASDRLARMIVGGDLERAHSGTANTRSGPSGAAARISNLRGGRLRGVELSVEPGEVLGLVGQPDSGAEDTLLSLFGALETPVSGTLRLPGESTIEVDLASLTPRRAVTIGIGLVPPERAKGAIGTISVRENITMQEFDVKTPFLAFANPARLARAADRSIREFDVRPPAAAQKMGTLSGGNQQKVILAKWLERTPALMLLDEPTQGVDIGARDQLQGFVRQAASAGAAVLWHSLDLTEVALVCDRILVFRRGQVAEEMNAPLDKSTIANACYGTTDRSAN